MFLKLWGNVSEKSEIKPVHSFCCLPFSRQWNFLQKIKLDKSTCTIEKNKFTCIKHFSSLIIFCKLYKIFKGDLVYDPSLFLLQAVIHDDAAIQQQRERLAGIRGAEMATCGRITGTAAGSWGKSQVHYGNLLWNSGSGKFIEMLKCYICMYQTTRYKKQFLEESFN